LQRNRIKKKYTNRNKHRKENKYIYWKTILSKNDNIMKLVTNNN
jgi:hypothetical protein